MWKKVWRRQGFKKKIFFLQLWIVTKIDDRSNKEVFFNNWFSSLSLISILKECVIRATWLLIRKQCKINKKDLKHQERVFIQTFYTKQGVMLSHVMIMVQFWLFQVSTDPYQVPTVHNQVLVSWSEYQNVKHSNCILFYNKPMGDVDVLNALVSNYTIDIHGKKWH